MDIKNANWGCLIKNPQVIFRITFINSNDTIEYRLKDDDERHTAFLDEILILDEKDIPDDIKEEYNDAIFLNL